MLDSFDSIELQDGIRFELMLTADDRAPSVCVALEDVASEADTEAALGFRRRVLGVGLHEDDVDFIEDFVEVAASFSLSRKCC